MPSYRKQKNMCLSKYMNIPEFQSEMPAGGCCGPSPAHRQRREERTASLTAEAALSFSLFLFAVLLLAVPVGVLNVQRQVQAALEAEARELSILAALPEGEKTAGAAGQLLLEARTAAAVCEAVRPGQITVPDCRKSFCRENGEEIFLRADYEIRLPCAVFRLRQIPAVSVSMRKGFTGCEGGYFKGEVQAEEEICVYVGKDSTRYHLTPDCHYLSNHLTAVSRSSLESLRNSDGKRYRPCRICGKGTEATQIFYVFPSGESFHSDPDCPSLSSYVKKVPLSEVRYLGACSYCGGEK